MFDSRSNVIARTHNRSSHRSRHNNNNNSARVNRQIRAKEVRLIGVDGSQLGVLPIQKAMEMAQRAELDLVEVAPNAKPPVCRLMDYGKYLYEKQKREKEARKAQKQVEIKEVRLRPKTDDHDIQVAVNKIRKFAADGAKTRVRIRFRGREIYHPDVARDLMDRVSADVSDVAEVESRPRLDGRSMIMVLAPT